jgi:NAD(P)-dependent dehydrogenase (short-subunit alcohol dehydrogenase family)
MQEVPEAADFLPLGADIGSPQAVESVFSDTLERFGRLDAVANVAGISLLGDVRLEDLDVETFDRVHRVNMRGTFLMCKAAIAPLRAQGGAIINLGSVASVRGVGGPAYVSSKAGIAGLTRAIAAQYAADQIRCNTVAPGPTSTPMFEQAKKKASVNTIGAPGTIPGEADPGEVAALIEFLAADTGRFMTGGIYTIDGGITQN